MLVSSENVHRSVNDAADVWQNKESVSLKVLCSSGSLLSFTGFLFGQSNTCFLLWEIFFFLLLVLLWEFTVGTLLMIRPFLCLDKHYSYHMLYIIFLLTLMNTVFNYRTLMLPLKYQYQLAIFKPPVAH